jgi:hypothetical protein
MMAARLFRLWNRRRCHAHHSPPCPAAGILGTVEAQVFDSFITTEL